MKIKAKVNGENQFLLDALNKKGVTANMIKDGIIVELPVIKDMLSNRVIYEIPAEVNDAELGIDLAESGGGLTKTGSAMVVCGLNGEALKPYYIPRRGHLACGEHAYFLVPGAVVTITAYRRDDKIIIDYHNIVRYSDKACIESKKLWEGQFGQLPKLMSRFQAAVEAAYEKANCFHCRHAHFIEMSGSEVVA